METTTLGLGFRVRIGNKPQDNSVHSKDPLTPTFIPPFDPPPPDYLGSPVINRALGFRALELCRDNGKANGNYYTIIGYTLGL